MPLHDYKCNSCGDIEERFVLLKDLDETQFCKLCLGKVHRLMPAPRIQMDYAGYSCPITGKWIEGKRAHRENLEKHGCRELEPGEKEFNEKRRARDNEEFEERIGESIARDVAALSPEKQSKLCQEMEQNLDLTYSRMGAE